MATLNRIKAFNYTINFALDDNLVSALSKVTLSMATFVGIVLVWIIKVYI